MTGNEIERHSGVDSWIDVMGPVGHLAGAIAKTEFVPAGLRNKPDAVAAAILTGRELNLGPLTSLRGIDVIDGRPRLSGELLGARILAAGHRIEWLESTDAKATVRIIRGDGLSEATATWSTKDADRAGLLRKKNWTQYPRDMLAIRALTEAARRACPDVSLGLEAAYAVDPGQSSAPEEHAVTIQIAERSGHDAPRTPVEGSQSDATAEPEQPAIFGVEAPDDASTAVYAEVVAEELPESAPEVAQSDADRGLDAEHARITGREIRHIHAIVSDLQKMWGRRLTPDQRRELVCEAAGIEYVDSLSDLTLAQAGLAIAALVARKRELSAQMEVAEE